MPREREKRRQKQNLEHLPTNYRDASAEGLVSGAGLSQAVCGPGVTEAPNRRGEGRVVVLVAVVE